MITKIAEAPVYQYGSNVPAYSRPLHQMVRHLTEYFVQKSLLWTEMKTLVIGSLPYPPYIQRRSQILPQCAPTQTT